MDLKRLKNLDLATLRTAAWTIRAARRANVLLRDRGLNGFELPPPPAVPPHAGLAVGAVLKRRHDSCLVRATVRQAWWRSQGDHRTLVIGVSKEGVDFSAHAWLEGDPPCHSEGFTELLRRSAV